MIRRISAFLPLLLLMLAGNAHKTPAKRNPRQAASKARDASAHTATIAAGKIDHWMEAMTMEYPVKPDAESQKLHVGDRIEATVVAVSYTHLRAHETRHDLVCRLLLEK